MNTVVAKPLLALDMPLSLTGLEKTTDAIKHLHGPDTFLKQFGQKAVVFAPGKHCTCEACDAFMRRVADLDFTEYPEPVHTCTTCQSPGCPAATDHENPCINTTSGGHP